METYAPRIEIERQMRAHLGAATNGILASQVAEQHTVFVRSAAKKVAQDCRWVNTIREETVTLQAEENLINYPGSCRPGSILEIAVFDSLQDRYFQLEQRVIRAVMAQDQQQSVGGDTFKEVQGRPELFEQRNQILLWPYSDKEYPLRIKYQYPIDLPTQDSISIVDAELIVLWATALAHDVLGDDRLSNNYRGMYSDRLALLRGWQSAGTNVAISTEADMGEDEVVRIDRPRWDNSPWVR